MKTSSLFLTFALFSFLFTHGQEKADHFRNLADTATEENMKLQYLDSVLKYLDQNNTEAFVNTSKEYIQLAEDLKNYQKMVAQSIKVFYSINTLQNNKVEATRIMEHALKYEDQITDSTLLGGLYLKLGGAYYEKDYVKAIDNYSMAIQKFSKKDSLKIADSHLFRAQAKSYLGDFLGATDDYNIATKYYEALHNNDYVIYAMNGISIIYEMNKFYDKALKTQDEIIAYAEKNNMVEPVVTTLYNRAIQYKEREMPAEREATLLRALDLNTNKNNKELLRDIFINGSLTRMYSDQGKGQQAKKHLANIERRLDEIRNDEFLMNHYYEAKSAVLALDKQYNEAIGLLKGVHDFHQNMSNYDHLVDLKSDLAALYEKSGDLEDSYKLFKEHQHLKDSIFNAQKTNSLIYYQTLYETEKKERELVEKNTSIALLEKDQLARKRLFGFSVAGLSLLFLTILLYRNRRYLKKSKEQQEKYSQQLLASQEEERARISKELHDGIGQSLLLIKNKIVLDADEGTKNMFNHTIEEVRSISRALHPFQLKEFGITKAIENTIRDFDENSDIFISSAIDDISGILPEEKELNLYRIVQESLGNVLKHSETEAAKVSVKRKEKTIEILIQDHGKGFDFSEKYNDFNSLGLKTLKERIKFMKGSMKVDSEKGKGTSLLFVIPIK